jgi:hypothetical protein
MSVNVNIEQKLWLIRRTRALFLGTERPVLEAELSSPTLQALVTSRTFNVYLHFFTYQIYSWYSD